MKVLLVITHGNIGGATNIVVDLAKGLKSRGIDVTVGYSEGEYLRKKLSDNAIPEIILKNIKRSHNPFAALFFVFEMKKLAKKAGFDVVQFNSSNALPGCLGVKLANRKIKTAFTVHGLSVLDKNCKTFFLLKFAYYLAFKFFFLFTDSVIFESKNNLEYAQSIKLVKDGPVIYNGLSASDLVFLSKDDAKSALEKKITANLGGKFLIGSIGRLSYQKNYEFLIKMFPEILKMKNDAACVVLGDGPDRSMYERLVGGSHLKNDFFLAGEVSDASQYLKAFDLFILPSRYEGVPVTLEECLFADVPVLASNVGGNNEILAATNLYRLNDEEDFMEKFSALLKNGIGVAGDTDLKQKFTADNMCQGYFDLFHRLS